MNNEASERVFGEVVGGWSLAGRVRPSDSASARIHPSTNCARGMRMLHGGIVSMACGLASTQFTLARTTDNRDRHLTLERQPCLGLLQNGTQNEARF